MATIRELELGTWRDDSVPEEFRQDAEMLCRLLRTFVADLVVSLSMFEQAQIEHSRRMATTVMFDEAEWHREAERSRAREEALTIAAGFYWGDPDHWETSNQLREQVRRECCARSGSEKVGRSHAGGE